MKPLYKFIARVVLAFYLIGRVDVIPTLYGVPSTPSDFWFGVLTGCIVLAVGPRGTKIDLTIKALSEDGAIRLNRFVDARNYWPWRYAGAPESWSGVFETRIPLLAAETFWIFKGVLLAGIKSEIQGDPEASFSVTVNNAS